MPYIGSKPSTSFVSMSKQDLTGSSGGSVTLSHAVANANEVALYINNVRQEPTESYTVSGSTLSFNGYTVSASDDIYVIFLGKALQTVVPPDASVGTAKIADSAVTNTKIANSTIDLTSKVTGVLPVANGGTGVSSNFSYEEGTWTPSITNGWGILNPTYSSQIGYYTKIGNLVHITFKIVLSGGTTNGNPILIGTLPFVSNQPTSNSGVYNTLHGSFTSSSSNSENVFFKVGNINTAMVQAWRRTSNGETTFTGTNSGNGFSCTFNGTYRTDL